jgi:hypothetical protein
MRRLHGEWRRTILTPARREFGCGNAGRCIRHLESTNTLALLNRRVASGLNEGNLNIGVITWVARPIKFQADMGVQLAFMFLWNMLGILVLLPALAYFFLKADRRSDVTARAFAQRPAATH